MVRCFFTANDEFCFDTGCPGSMLDTLETGAWYLQSFVYGGMLALLRRTLVLMPSTSFSSMYIFTSASTEVLETHQKHDSTASVGTRAGSSGLKCGFAGGVMKNSTE